MIIMILLVLSCKKDDGIEQIQFTLKNMTTLIEESSDYILSASPGTVYINTDDYIYFSLGEEIQGIGASYLYYHLNDDLCDYIIVLPYNVDLLNDTEILMQLTEDEVGVAEIYYLSYYDDSSVLQEEEFDSLAELWSFVETEGLTVDDMDKIEALYYYGDYYLIAGGMYYSETDHFESMIEIGMSDLLKKSKSTTQHRHADFTDVIHQQAK